MATTQDLREFVNEIKEKDDFDYSGSDESPQTTSCTYGDYGPSNPWDAPGMSIRDFI